MFTTARRLFLYWPLLTQFLPLSLTIHFDIIPSSVPRSSRLSLSVRFPYLKSVHAFYYFKSSRQFISSGTIIENFRHASSRSPCRCDNPIWPTEAVRSWLWALQSVRLWVFQVTSLKMIKIRFHNRYISPCSIKTALSTDMKCYYMFRPKLAVILSFPDTS